jgi:hypothetical protein
MEQNTLTYNNLAGNEAFNINAESVRSYNIKDFDKTISVKIKDIHKFATGLGVHSQWTMLLEDNMIQAINNLLKKNEFLQVTLQLTENLITEEEYELEITSHPDKYIIDTHELSNPFTMNAIQAILRKINRNFTTDEVSEMFSVSPESIDKFMQVQLSSY